MLTLRPPSPIPIALWATLSAYPFAANAVSLSSWDAAGGLMPDQASPAWVLGNTAQQAPVLEGGHLSLSTAQVGEYQFYQQSGALLDTSGGFYIEARLRYLAGTSDHPDRTGAVIGFTTAPNVGNALFIRNDEVFFNTDNMQAGPSAFVDTDDAFHTYRIEASLGGALALFYDGGNTPILTGQTFFSEPFSGLENSILWGDGTFLAAATTEWASFSHNALAVPVPAAAWLFGSALAVALAMGRRRV